MCEMLHPSAPTEVDKVTHRDADKVVGIVYSNVESDR